ncbi:MAG: PKD domain-containing protein [Porphyromonadaceae bacterium]|nr:MAG: PKD domain-containing protein [Porphyromonadaceae bacterium]
MRVELKFISTCSIGLLITILTFISCNKINLPPVAVLEVFPSIGDTTIFFDFSSAGSEDDRNYPIALQYRWDFDGDGLWDTEYSRNNGIAHQYKQPGSYHVLVEVKDIDGLSAIAGDSVEVFGMNPDTGTMLDSRDGNQYRIVKINDQWWMAENLRYGTVIPTDREQTDNDTVEMYRILNSEPLDTIGGIYLWIEAMNYRVTDPRGICPEGWHIPTRKEWEGLFAPYPRPYSLQYYGSEGLSNLNLDLRNGGRRTNGTFEYIDLFYPVGVRAGFWSSSFTLENALFRPYYCSFNSEEWLTWYDLPLKGGLIQYYSVRCVKDNR